MQALPSIGSIIDETYEIKSLLGKGGFGAVFLARHIPMEREIALKLLLPQGHNPGEMVERFRREVMAIRNLSHPNTVRIFDYRDSVEDTLIYYTMEYLRGETLKDVVRAEGPQSPRRVTHIIRQILKSLAEAHALGIVHRDLKPANIMLVQMYGEEDFVKVLDFGIAKIMEQEDDEDEPLTSAGMLVGTLRYMSPEQIKGLPLGPYTDIYALGLITLEMLIGQSVFAGTGRWEILQKQVSPEAIEFPPELYDSPIRPVLERMLAKESSARYPNAETLLKDLNSIPIGTLSDAPIVTSPRANLPTLPGHHSSNSGPAPRSQDNTPTAISEAHTLVPHAVAPPHIPERLQATKPGAPTLPMPSVHPKPTPNFPPISPHHQETALDDSDIIPPARASKLPLVIGVGVLLAVLIGGVLLVSSISKDPPASPPPVKTASLQDRASAETTPVEQPLDDKPVVVEEEPQKARQITLSLAQHDVEATAFLDGKELGALPLTHPVDAGASITLTVRAEDFETQTVTLDDNSPAALPITLTAMEKPVQKENKPEPKKTVRVDRPPTKEPTTKTTEKPVIDDWAEITSPKKKKEEPKAKEESKKPFVPGFD